MARCSRRLGAVLCHEAAGVLLFFGSLAQNGGLAEAGRRAVAELSSRGYVVATPEDPVRVYPAGAADFEALSTHAAHWSPGVIRLRENPEGRHGIEVYLRHELMHQANHRSCAKPLPRWADEAAALSFSGELTVNETVPADTEGLTLLRRQVRVGAPITPRSRDALRILLAQHGWPEKPCAVNDEVRRSVEGDGSPNDGFAYRLINVASTRLFEAAGDQRGEFPPGSVLKIPFAASLPVETSGAVGRELALSDTAALLERSEKISIERFEAFLGRSIREAGGARIPAEVLLGLRAKDGLFPLQLSLAELALALRSVLLSAPENLRGLDSNGVLPGSTLYGAEGIEVLSELRAAAKTGTVSDETGNPVLGTLAVWWPADAPRWLALFRQSGGRGKTVFAAAAPLLKEWAQRYPVRFSTVRVAVLGQFPPAQSALSSVCPAIPAPGRYLNRCGSWRIETDLQKAQPVRYLRGVFEERDGTRVLETDALTYSEAVLRREGDTLRGEARKALQAVIVFNGAAGGLRHPARRALCDTTHCMVFQGHSTAFQIAPDSVTKESAPGPGAFPEPDLLQLLTSRTEGKDPWLPFSKGGGAKWSRELSAAKVAQVTGEPLALALERVRDRRGAVRIVLHYPDSQEAVSCETFMTRFDLPSCPGSILAQPDGGWIAAGSGAGHGEGMQVHRAEDLAAEGKSARQILEDAYPAATRE